MEDIYFMVFEDNEYQDSFNTLKATINFINERKEFNEQFDCLSRFKIEIHNEYGLICNIEHENI